MTLAHLGVAVFVAGVTLVRSYQTEADLRMVPGASLEVGRHVLVFEGVTPVTGPNYDAQRGNFTLSRDGRVVARLHPEKRRYRSLPATPMTEAAIDSGFLGDIYVSLGEDDGQGAWTVRAYHKPLVTWIWGGCVMMALGGLLAALDRRYRAAHQPRPGRLYARAKRREQSLDDAVGH
jgi:cytochrome c-type biogenesis protein CcmF